MDERIAGSVCARRTGAETAAFQEARLADDCIQEKLSVRPKRNNPLMMNENRKEANWDEEISLEELYKRMETQETKEEKEQNIMLEEYLDTERAGASIEELERQAWEKEARVQDIEVEIEQVDEVIKRAKAASVPVEPTDKEREDHEVTHVPFRAWCRFCVAGTAPTPSHKKIKDRELPERLPRMSIDYFFIWGKPMLAIKETKTKCIWAIASNRKGSTATAVPERLAEIIASLSYDKLILRSDQEPAIIDLQTEMDNWRKDNLEITASAMMNRFGTKLIIENSGVGDSQANGDIEEAIRRIRGEVRTLIVHIEAKSGGKVRADSRIMEWAVEHAASMIRRYQCGEDGKTGHERHRGHHHERPSVPFGECVWYLQAKTRQHKDECERWKEGVMLGNKDSSMEYIVGTPYGVIKTPYPPRRRPKKDQYNIDEINRVKGSPWEPCPGKNGHLVPTGLGENDGEENEDKDNIDGGEPSEDNVRTEIIMEDDSIGIERPFVPRSFYVRAWHIERFKHTEQCPGCSALLNGTQGTRTHTQRCRERIIKLILESDDTDPIMKNSKDRIKEAEKKHNEKESGTEEKKNEDSKGVRRPRDDNEDEMKQSKKARAEDIPDTGANNSRTETTETVSRNDTDAKIRMKTEAEDDEGTKRRRLNKIEQRMQLGMFRAIHKTGAKYEIPGGVFDINQVDHDDHKSRNRAIRHIMEQKPALLRGGCGPEDLRAKGIRKMMAFQSLAYGMQAREGRHFIHHQWGYATDEGIRCSRVIMASGCSANVIINDKEMIITNSTDMARVVQRMKGRRRRIDNA